MFLRDREYALQLLNKQAVFLKSFIDDRPEGIDFLTWDKEAHHQLLTELIGMLHSSRKGFPWSSEESEYVVELFNQNMNFSDIAKELRRTPGSVLARLEKEECIPRNFHDYEKYIIRNKSELLDAMEKERLKGAIK